MKELIRGSYDNASKFPTDLYESFPARQNPLASTETQCGSCCTSVSSRPTPPSPRSGSRSATSTDRFGEWWTMTQISFPTFTVPNFSISISSPVVQSLNHELSNISCRFPHCREGYLGSNLKCHLNVFTAITWIPYPFSALQKRDTLVTILSYNSICIFI